MPTEPDKHTEEDKHRDTDGEKEEKIELLCAFHTRSEVVRVEGHPGHCLHHHGDDILRHPEEKVRNARAFQGDVTARNAGRKARTQSTLACGLHLKHEVATRLHPHTLCLVSRALVLCTVLGALS